MLGLLLLLVLSVGLLYLPAVQTYVAKTTVNQLFAKDEVDFELQELDITPFSSVKFHGLFLSDKNHDTLVYANSIEIRLTDWMLSPINFRFDSVGVDSLKFYLSTAEGDSNLNLQFVIDRFVSNKEDTNAAEFDLAIEKVSLSSIYFKWDDFNQPDTGFGVNFNHLNVAHLNGDLGQLVISDNEISAQIDTLRLTEKSGLQIDQISTDIVLNDDIIDLKKLLIQTPQTYLAGQYAMKHNNYQGFSDYVKRVEMTAVLDSTVINSADISYFVPQLEGMKEIVSIDGEYNGTVSSFEMPRFRIGYGTSTYLVGKLDIHGLPEINSTQMNIYLDKGYVLKADLTRIPLPPFSDNQTLDLPQQLNKWRYAKIDGKYIGTIKNFIADAQFRTNLGTIISDVQVSNKGVNSTYQGAVDFNSLQMGNLLNNNDFDLVSGSLKIKGKGTDARTADVLAKGRIRAFDFRNYRYNNIALDGEFKDRMFIGQLDVNDPNCQLGFNGALNFQPHQDTYRFKLKIDTLYPVIVGLIDRDSSAFFSGKLDVDMVGSTLDTAKGKAYITDLFYAERDSSFELDTLNFESFVEDSLRHLYMTSSLGDVAIKGDAILKGVDEAVAKILDDAVPTYFEKEYNVADNQGGLVVYASFNEKLNDVVSVFLPAFRIDSNLEVRGSLFLDPPLLNFSAKSQGISYSTFVLDSFELKGGFSDSVFNVDLIADTISFNKNIRVENLNLQSGFSEDSVNLYLDYFNTGDKRYAGEINLTGKILGAKHFGFHLNDAFVEVADSVWVFNDENYVEIDSNFIRIDSLNVSSFDKYISLQGRISESVKDTINLEFNNLNLSNIGRMTNKEDLVLGGTASGKITSQSTLSNPNVLMNVSILGLELNEMPIGSGDLVSVWDNEQKRAEVDFDLIRLPDSIIPDTLHSLKVAGFIYPNREKHQLDLKLGTQGFYLKSLEPFTNSFMDSLDGKVTGYIHVDGEFTHPVLEGEFDLVDTRLRVKYLNTLYFAKKEKLRIEEDWFGFDNLKLIDQNGNKANTIATVYHTNFTDLNYDVSVKMDSFLVLNTTKYDNDLFYGIGHLSGDINLSGYDQTLIMEMNAKTAKQSEFVIPLTGADEIGQSDFITFVNSDGSVELENQKETDLSGIEMTFNLDVDPTAKVRMIFDETTGDELSARGDGKIKMLINSDGDFGMYGKYRVLSGDYGFTYKNAFSKKFVLEEGGSVSWNGDPETAKLDVTAIYNVRAPLGELLGDSTMTSKINNQCLMKMTGSLDQPEINFDIRLPNASPGIAQQVKSQMSSQEEVDKQVFSLLLFNKYSPPQSGFSAGGMGQATSSDLLSNQLNNWISKMDNNLFDLGVNEVKSDEVEIAVSKKLLDDRLILESNVGVNRTGEDGTTQEGEAGQFVGDFKLEYLITKSGKVRGKVFNRTENRSSIENVDGANSQTQGVGIVLREDFNSAKELWQKTFNNPTRKQKRKDKKEEKAREKATKEDED